MEVSCICLLEENEQDFLPITYTRKIYDIIIGGTSLKDKIQRCFPDFFVGNLHECSLRSERSVKFLINSRVIFNQQLKDIVLSAKINEVYFYKDKFIFAKIDECKESFKYILDQVINKNLLKNESKHKDKKIKTNLSLQGQNTIAQPRSLVKIQLKINVEYINYPWDIIKLNGNAICEDFDFLKKDKEINLDNIDIIGDVSNLYIGSDVKIYGKIVINVESGPVFIDDNVIIKAPSIIEGPAFIGKNSLIDTAKIREETSIGENCKISGEIASSIFQAYSNKHHDGFIGHSYIGAWVNMGAMTTNSDLKNNYHSVKVKVQNKLIDTEELKVGCFVGDYTTFGIGTLIPTGANIGCCCNIFGSGLIERYYKPFTWYNNANKQSSIYDMEKAFETIKIMKQRRGLKFTESEKKLLKVVKSCEKF